MIYKLNPIWVNLDGVPAVGAVLSSCLVQPLRLFGGNGAPGPDTLPGPADGTFVDNPQYVAGVDLYTDTSSTPYPLYLCSASGNASATDTQPAAQWQKIAGGGGSSSVQLWTPGSTAGNGSLWVLQSGPATGLYISTAAGNNNSPDTGINWVQLSGVLNVWQ